MSASRSSEKALKAHVQKESHLVGLEVDRILNKKIPVDLVLKVETCHSWEELDDPQLLKVRHRSI